MSNGHSKRPAFPRGETAGGSPSPARPKADDPRPPAGNPEAPLARRSPYARWRALALFGVYLAIAAHVVHWRLSGRTLAPLELHEVMFTLELGVVTAGFLFMALACVATATFGRFLCGWGCHIMALEDGCAWLLRRAGLRPKPIRSRLLAWVPLGVLVYMFLWPQVLRIGEGRPFPPLRFSSDTEGVASFATTNFWRNLPGPWITALTFLVVGLLAVWVLGSRGFCAYGCPYGALFGLADRLAPGRVRVNERCRQCGTCTAVCTSGVRVHEEVRNFGMVVDPRCVKDLDCVGSCPERALSFGFGRPALAKGTARGAPALRRYDFTLLEEAGMGVVFLATLLAFRGLYNRVPFLLTVGLGGVAAYVAVLLARLATRREVSLAAAPLKAAGRVRPAGWAFAATAALFFGFAAQSGFVQFHVWRGRKAFEEIRSGRGSSALAESALADFAAVDRWSLLPTVETKVRLAWLRAGRGEREDSERLLREAVAVDPHHAESRFFLGESLSARGETGEAMEHYAEAVRLDRRHGPARWRLGLLHLARGEREAAARLFGEAGAIDPRYVEAARAALEGAGPVSAR
ncbi:MAG TPA: tetratricopeptide repeat protein [Planctomycetota bacterium]|nr:tetratricopeptide repeat protein [Planctomycetota bacterium]